MFGDEDLIAVGGREHGPGVKAHAQRGDMRAQFLSRRGELVAAAFGAELGVGKVARVAIRITKMHSGAWRVVEFVARQIVSQHVAAVVGKPELPGPRLPVEADRVAHATRIGFHRAAIRVHAQNIGVLRVRFADIAGCANRHVELAVRSEGDEFPSMLGFGWQLVGHDYRCRRIVQAPLDVVKTQNAAYR